MRLEGVRSCDYVDSLCYFWQAKAGVIPSCVLLLHVIKELRCREVRFACISYWVGTTWFCIFTYSTFYLLGICCAQVFFLCLFSIYSVSKNSKFWIALSNLLNLIKGAISSLGIMWKAIAYSIRNCLFYLPAKSQGPATAWTRVISKFQRLLKRGDCFFGFCALTTFWKAF